MDYIQLKDDSILRIGIKDPDGNETSEYLEFDLADIELLDKYQKLYDEDKKARKELKTQFTIINKKQDSKGKGLMTVNEETEVKAVQNFYKKEVEIYNGFLGENGVQKILCGRKINWKTLGKINELIKTEIAPKLKINYANVKEEIKKLYSIEESDVLEDETEESED